MDAVEKMDLLDFEKLRQERERLGLTIAEAARRAGMKHRQNWDEVEKGRRTNVTLDLLAAMAAAVGLKPRDLVKNVSRADVAAWLAGRVE